jgi:hypothetical protein
MDGIQDDSDQTLSVNPSAWPRQSLTSRVFEAPLLTVPVLLFQTTFKHIIRNRWLPSQEIAAGCVKPGLDTPEGARCAVIGHDTLQTVF